jgi:geranylgeranyl pyrophosphate synthase
MYNNIFLVIIIILILYVLQWDIYIKKKINRLFVNTDIKLTTDISTLKKTQKYIDNILIKSVNDDFNNTGMLEICQTVTKGGKRVRGILMLEVFNILNKKYSADLIDDAVIFIEYIQASSLIFDDIVDGDVSRRGEKCVHVTHGIGVAQLVGLSLVSKAFHRLTNIMEKIERATHDDKIFRRSTKLWINMIKNIHKNTNILIQGQYIDITTTATITNNADMFDIINFKTASLFELCYIIPYILVNIDADKNDDDIRNEIEGAKRIGRLFGIIFQISDDFEDYYDDISNMNNGAVNYVCNNGRDKAVSDYYKLVDIYTDVCTDHKIFTNNTKIIINYLNEKVDKYSEIIK